MHLPPWKELNVVQKIHIPLTGTKESSEIKCWPRWALGSSTFWSTILMPLLELVTYSSLKVQLWEVWWSKARPRDFQKESSHTHSHFQTPMQVRANAFPYSLKPLGPSFSKCSLILSTVLRASANEFHPSYPPPNCTCILPWAGL